MANQIVAGNSSNGGTAISTDTSGTLNIVTGSGSGSNAITIDASQAVTMSGTLAVTGAQTIGGNLTVTGTLSATGGVTGSITRGTAVASTSGTSIDFTGIPSGVKRITVMFSGVSGSGTSPLIIQLGSSSIQNTGYLSFAQNGVTSGVTTVIGMLLTANQSAAGTHTGNVIVTNITSNSWVSSGVMQDIVNANGSIFASSVSLSGVLDRIRVTTINGTDTFDAGTINILFE